MKPSLILKDELKDKENHPICIYDLTFSPDGQALLVCADNKIYVYDLGNNGSLMQTLKGHKDVVLAINFAHDGKRFATGSVDKQVIIWTSNMEAILKYSHNDSVRCLQYNPTSYQLLSCTNFDFGLWSPEQKNVTKIKVTSQINCCCWNQDGIIFALGFNSGGISIRFKNGEEKIKIDRRCAVWGLVFFKSDDTKSEDRLAVVDWSKCFATYDVDGNQNIQERSINQDPLFLTAFSNNQFFLIGGTNKQVSLYTKDGFHLETIATQESWIWCCSAHANKLAIGCQNGSLSVFDISLMMVDCSYKELYAYRDSMTDVVVQHLYTNEKARIQCQDLVKRIAIYKTLLAIQLGHHVILYESDEGVLNYHVTREQINLEQFEQPESNELMIFLCETNLILTFDDQMKSLNLDGKLEKEWQFKSLICFTKLAGGIPGTGSLLVGLKDGQVLLVFLSNTFPVELLKITNPIRFIDLSLKRQKVAIIDEQYDCSVYDMNSKQLLYQIPGVASLAWNQKFDDLLCFAGSGILGIKYKDVPAQTIELSDKFTVIGYCGDEIHTLVSNIIQSKQISYTKLLWNFVQQNKFSEAYRIACLHVTFEDWQMLTNMAISKYELMIGRKCLYRIGDWSYQELIYSHFQQPDALSETNRQLFLAKYYAYQGLFSEAAKLFKKNHAIQLAVEMFTDLQMYEQAKEYQSLMVNNNSGSGGDHHPNQSSNNSGNATGDHGNSITSNKLENMADLSDIKALSKMYIAKGDHAKALEMIAKTDINSIMALANQTDKGEIKLLNMVAENFIQNNQLENAIQIYRKIGDFKRLALCFIQNDQWQEALKIANDMPHMKEDIYFPYAMWLAEHEKFAEAQQAFFESGKLEESRKVLQRLLRNAIDECRFDDASYYSWLLAQNEDISEADSDGGSGGGGDLHMKAEIYYAYQYIYKYIEEPFTSVYAEILFNSALFLFQFIDVTMPLGVSKVYILFALAKLGKTLGHYKLVRMVYKKLKNLRLPEKLSELIQIGSIAIRTKPFVDAEELSLFCYRCSTTSSVFASKLDHCINCNHKFMHSFYSFDVLPLVEFELSETISPNDVDDILAKNPNPNPASSEPSRRGSVALFNGPNNQQSEVYTHDLLSEHLEQQQQRFDQTINLVTDINPETNLAIISEKHLSKLNQTNVIIVNERLHSKVTRRYFLNMMPEIEIVACPNCFKFFYSDEFEFQILKNGNCLFCRQ